MRRFATDIGAVALAAGVAVVPSHAFAQRTEQNAATQSDDAFGRTIGNERSGLYTGTDVRGFNPSEAGNIRLDGLYFDLVNLISSRQIEGLTVRVGIAAQRYPFPAPTGLVDYQLAVPHDRAELSIELDTASSFVLGPGALADFKLPLQGERLGIAGGAAGRQATRLEGGHHKFRTFAGLLAFRPAEGTELVAFSSQLWTLSQDGRATYFPAGSAMPARVRRGKYLGLDWTEYDQHAQTHGGIAHVRLGQGLRIDAGLFYSRQRLNKTFADFLFGVTPDGDVADRRVYAADNNVDESLSGEFRLVREWVTKRFEHRLIASLRGRHRTRLFGGNTEVRLGGGPGTIFTAEGWPRPAYTPGPKNTDNVRQLVPGLAYSLLWRGGASLDISVSKNRYSKRLDFANAADAVTRDRSLLWNVSGSFALKSNLYVFGGLSRGLEDAIVAPDGASNPAEAPPAIRTRQKEFGMRFGVTRNLALVAGLFSISKPYFNLDRQRHYGQLGTVTHRGVELSLTGRLAPGVSAVGGVLLLDPRIKGEGVDSGLIGRRPIGQARRHVVANLDWRTAAGRGAWSFDLSLESFSRKVANAANTLRAPGHSLVNLGARYRFAVGDAKFVLRPQVTNVLNSYGWLVSSIGGLTYSRRRTAVLALVADF